MTSPSLPISILGQLDSQIRAEFFDSALLERLDSAASHLGGRVEWCEQPQNFKELLNDSERAAEVQVVISGWRTPTFDDELLAQLPRLRVVAHSGASVKHLASPQLFERNVFLTQAGDAMAHPVAEVALTFTLGLLHQVHRFDYQMRTQEVFSPGGSASDLKFAVRPQREILGARIGVVGASRTGRAYIRLVRALGAHVSVYDPYLSAAEASELGVHLSDLDTLMAASQIVALHAPTLPQTHHMIDAARLRLLADGAGLVNTARSWLVDEQALVSELATGRIDAALDVFDEEPLPSSHPLRTLPNVLLTPHRAAGTVEGRLRGGAIVCDEIDRFVCSQPLQHAISEEQLERMA